jgi:HSP20 family protein
MKIKKCITKIRKIMSGLALLNRGRDIPSLFDTFFNDSYFNGYQKPAYMEWDDNENKGKITIEAPGFSKEDIKIESDSDGITITGEVKDDEMKSRLRQASFSYVLRRSDIDTKKVNAKLENGILTVDVQKAKDKLSRVIEIQ